MAVELISRKEAIGLGLHTYFTGVACKYGHISARRVNNGCCTACAKILTSRWRKQGVLPTTNQKGNVLPTIGYLQECFDYHSDGCLIWKERPLEHFSSIRGWRISNKCYSNKVAGSINSRNGYLEVRLDNVLYKGHRLIYKLLTGKEPELMIDHIDGDVKNNRIENLREATNQENCRNSKKRNIGRGSQYKGVMKGRNGGWLCSITVNDKAEITKHNSELSAALYYDKRAKELFGDYASLNFKENN